MIEKTIYLEGIEPVTIYGINNANLDKIKLYFPKIKIVARGAEIKAIGDSKEIMEFEEKIESIIDHIQRKNAISDDDLEHIILSIETPVADSYDKEEDVLIYGNHGKAIRAKTINQRKLVKEYKDNDLLFAIGPAGTGKTYTAIALAVRSLRNKEIQRIILTRPAVEAGENLGFLPGDLKEKMDPYLQPLYDALGDMIPPKKLQTYIEEGIIEIAPLAFMRGRTLGNAVVILDEGQNTSVKQLKMFLTRMGKNSKFIITGDITQIDLPERTGSGLVKALHILNNIHGISMIEFDTRDIIRHRLVKYIVNAYEENHE
ncbi:MAG: PhoH family protein [Bacteroidales bacterium]|nr:PhoH family protein [Bacteroidales bacterium]